MKWYRFNSSTCSLKAAYRCPQGPFLWLSLYFYNDYTRSQNTHTHRTTCPITRSLISFRLMIPWGFSCVKVRSPTNPHTAHTHGHFNWQQNPTIVMLLQVWVILTELHAKHSTINFQVHLCVDSLICFLMWGTIRTNDLFLMKSNLVWTISEKECDKCEFH